MQEQLKKYAVVSAAASLFGVLAGAGLLFLVMVYYQPWFFNLEPSLPVQPAVNEKEIEKSPEPVYEFEEDRVVSAVEKVQPAVVSIMVTKDLPKYERYYQLDPFFEDFFSDPFFQGLVPGGRRSDEPIEMENRHIGGGSGFFVTEDGLIVTNKHVVLDEEAEYTVVTYAGDKYQARVLVRDPIFDLAYLKVEGQGFSYLEFADSDQIKLGQTVLAVGNALDEFRNTVTMGIVSGLNRRLTAGSSNGSAEVIESAIQTDAAINPGNSGGPLVDLNGRVIGVNTAVSLQGQLIGFALPSNLVKRGVEQVRDNGKIVRRYLGVRYQLVTKDMIQKNNLKVDYGALILRGLDINELAVMPGSPADKAGLRENDIILEINGRKIDEEHSLAGLIAGFVPGDEVELKIYRAGEELSVKAVLEELK